MEVPQPHSLGHNSGFVTRQTAVPPQEKKMGEKVSGTCEEIEFGPVINSVKY